MQTIGPPKGNGTLDTVLVQAEGKTGDHVRPASRPKPRREFRAMGQVPEQNKAAKYDGQWKGL